MDRRKLRARHTILLFLLLFCSNSKAIISLYDSSPVLDIGDKIEFLADPSGQLSFDQIRASKQFTPSQSARPSFGFSSSVYWVRFRIANLSSTKDWLLQVRYAPLDYIDFFSPSLDQPGAFNQYRGGDLVPPPSGRRKQTYTQFPLLPNDKVHTYYLRIKTQSSIILNLKIMTQGALQERSINEQYFQGAYFGVMSVMALYNFFVFLVIRDRSYLYYTGFIASTAVFQIALHGYAAVHFWPHSIWWNNVSNLFAACLSVGFCGKFAQNFIQLHKYHRPLNQALGILSLLCFLIGGLSLFINYQLIVMLISVIGFLVVTTSMLAAAYALKQGSRPAGFYLLAWLILLLLSLVHILVIVGILPTLPILENSVQIGGTLEAILLSMGLADRVNTLQKKALHISENANKMKDDFMSTITHELLTPVNGIKLSLELLKQNIDKPSDRQLLKTAENSSTHLMNLIESMFNFVELRRGNIKLIQEPVDLKWILTSIYDYFVSVNDNQSLHFHLNWDDSLPDFILTDERKITTMAVELIKNAYAFTQQGHISISARKVIGSQPKFQISIQDTGRGISKEKLKHLFEAFDQEDNSNLRQHNGLGIGLAVTRDILTLMGGFLDIQSEQDKGTTATITLPLTECNNTKPKLNPLRNQHQQSHHHKHKILVVEDNPVNSKLLCQVLQNAHYIAVAVGNGKEALEQLDNDPDFSAVLMDCQMPVMDGFQATRIIRRHHRHNNIPVIAITANISAEDRDHCLESGMSDVLTKPVRKDQIEAILLKWLS